MHAQQPAPFTWFMSNRVTAAPLFRAAASKAEAIVFVLPPAFGLDVKIKTFFIGVSFRTSEIDVGYYTS
jgi:hypothetical protein